MKHLLSINAYHYVRGGADVVYFDHAALFEEHGWHNSFYSMHHENNLPSKDSEFFAENIDYHHARSNLEKITQAGRVIYSFEAKRKIAALLDSRRVDVAHVHNIYHHQSPSILVELKRRGIPTVMTAHDLKLACPNYKMMNRTGVCERCKGGKVWNTVLYKCVQNSAVASALIAVESAVHKALNLYDRNLDRIVAPSKFYRQKLIEWGWDGDKIVYIPNFLSTVPPGRASPGGDYLLYFGRLAAEKGLATLVRAAAMSGVPIKIAGTGPDSDKLKALSAELGAPVEFVGFQSGAALWALIDNARAVVLPSEWYENGPISVVEAFFRGKPLVGAAIGGIFELVDEGETGWAFQSGNAEDLARALTIAMSASSADLEGMALATVSRATRDFSPEVYYSRVRALYGELGVQG